MPNGMDIHTLDMISRRDQRIEVLESRLAPLERLALEAAALALSSDGTKYVELVAKLAGYAPTDGGGA